MSQPSLFDLDEPKPDDFADALKELRDWVDKYSVLLDVGEWRRIRGMLDIEFRITSMEEKPKKPTRKGKN